MAELVGTALPVSIGPSVVILLFGTAGALVAISPVVLISGAHVNPAVTLAFWISDKASWRDVICYA